MPYRQGSKWRAAPKYKGERLSQRVCETKKEAIEWERRQKEEAKKIGKNGRSWLPGLDLLTFCSKYLIYTKRFVVKTQDEKKYLCKRILNIWGRDRAVDRITSGDIQAFLDDRANDITAYAANKDRKNLNAMWVYGIDFLGLKSNPVSVTKNMPHSVALKPVYNEQDVYKLLAASNREERIILLTFIESAGRRMEIWSLTWNDINIEKQAIQLWTKKTSDGSRQGEWLPISEGLAAEYKWWWNNRTIRNDYVFPNSNTGKPYVDPRKWLKRICQKARVPYKGFHALRRYVASILDDKYKMSRKLIQTLLRHKKESTTERYLFQIHTDLRQVVGLAVPQKKVPQTVPQKKKGVNHEIG